MIAYVLAWVLGGVIASVVSYKFGIPWRPGLGMNLLLATAYVLYKLNKLRP